MDQQFFQVFLFSFTSGLLGAALFYFTFPAISRVIQWGFSKNWQDINHKVEFDNAVRKINHAGYKHLSLDEIHHGLKVDVLRIYPTDRRVNVKQLGEFTVTAIKGHPKRAADPMLWITFRQNQYRTEPGFKVTEKEFLSGIDVQVSNTEVLNIRHESDLNNMYFKVLEPDHQTPFEQEMSAYDEN